MMHSDWREIKNMLLALSKSANLPKSKVADHEPKVYVK
jgi:hypothetical protein